MALGGPFNPLSLSSLLCVMGPRLRNVQQKTGMALSRALVRTSFPAVSVALDTAVRLSHHLHWGKLRPTRRAVSKITKGSMQRLEALELSQ